MQLDIAIPMLPSKNMEQTEVFYRALHFVLAYRHPAPDSYLILRHEPIELHFFEWPGLAPADNNTGCYLRVSDADAWYALAREQGFAGSGFPAVMPIRDTPWRMREFSIIDPSGNLLRIGTPLHRRAG